MSENTNVDVENLTPEQLAAIEESEDFITSFKEEDYDDPDKVEELRKHVENSKTTIHQKRHFRDKVKTLEAKLTEKDTKPKDEETPKPKPEAKDDKGSVKVIDPTEILDFRLNNPSLSKESIGEITRLAGALGVSMEEMAGSETGKAVITRIESKNDNSESSIAPSRKGGSGIEKRDWSTASPSEIEAQRNAILQGQ